MVILNVITSNLFHVKKLVFSHSGLCNTIFPQHTVQNCVLRSLLEQLFWKKAKGKSSQRQKTLYLGKSVQNPKAIYAPKMLPKQNQKNTKQNFIPDIQCKLCSLPTTYRLLYYCSEHDRTLSSQMKRPEQAHYNKKLDRPQKNQGSIPPQEQKRRTLPPHYIQTLFTP